MTRSQANSLVGLAAVIAAAQVAHLDGLWQVILGVLTTAWALTGFERHDR